MSCLNPGTTGRSESWWRRVRAYLRIVEEPSRLPALDGLRAIAILMVMVAHGLRPFRKPKVSLIPFGSWDLAAPLYNGWMGVDLFFALSGFLITYQIQRRWRGSLSALHLRDYVGKRFWRIVPTYYVALFIVSAGLIPGFPVAPEHLGWRVGYHLLFLQDYLRPDILNTFWSLGVEEKFYLLMPLLWWTLLRVRPRTQFLVLATLLALPLVFRGLLIPILPRDWRFMDYFIVLRTPFHMNVGTLAMGIACALLYQNTPSWMRGEAMRSLVLWFGILSFVLIVGLTPPSLAGVYERNGLLGIPGIGMGALLLGVLLAPHRSPGFLRHRALAVVAKLSYSLYLLHLALVPGLWALMHDIPAYASWGPTARASVFLPVYFTASFAAALVLHYVVEKPCLRRKDRIGAVGRPRTPAPTHDTTR